MTRPAQMITIKEVEDACLAALDLADSEGMKVIAMPGLGTGVGRVPFDKAAEVIINTIKAFDAKNLEKVILVDMKKEMIEAFKKWLKQK
jgi:O-acetyl-ADP-ribose deacetylase (regulator of RNase III)